MYLSDESISSFNKGLMQFLDRSVSPYHAVLEVSNCLLAAGFIRLDEQAEWRLEQGKRYFVVRGGSSIAAFVMGEKSQPVEGIRLLGAHTDSPVLAIKPEPDINKEGLFQIGVEVYGGALLNPWFDRDLSVAGRVSFLGESNSVRSSLVNFSEPIAFIPSLAIHLDRDANTNRNINSQKHIIPIVMHVKEGSNFDFRAILKRQIEQELSLHKVERILDHDLVLYDTQKASHVGLQEEFIASARLDNLLSCYCCLQAMLGSNFQYSSLFVFNDHEEVGSASNIGAQGPFLKDILRRMCGTEEAAVRSAQGSVLISTDNAHAIHPNFSDRHDRNHSPRLNDGPVIKVNTNQRYATNIDSAALFRMLAHSAGIPVQTFVMRSDMRCGSTIGPISAANTGISTVDVGVPTLGMHSIRELAGYKDGYGLFKVLVSFLDSKELS